MRCLCFLLPACLLSLGCGQGGLSLPPTASASRIVPAPRECSLVPSQCGTIEEFEGEVELFGHSLKARRQVTLTKSGDWVRQGLATAWYPSGQKAGEMSFRDDKPHGKQVIWHENGRKKLHGEWQQGLAAGKWTEWHDNGQMKSEGEFLDGEKHGKWAAWDEEGTATSIAQFDRGREITVASDERGYTR
jgi:hypothetical protein